MYMVKKKRSEARKHENLTDGVPHAPSPSDDRNPTSPKAALPSLAPSRLQGDATKVQRWEVNLRKELAGGEISPETLQQQARNLTVHRRFQGSLTAGLLQKKWLELETSGLHITEPDKNSERRCQRFCKLLSKAGAVHMLKRERGERKKPHHIRDLWRSSTPVT